MRKLYFLLFLAFSFMANAQIVNIPDANFKAKLLAANNTINIASSDAPNSDGSVNTYNTVDTNGDGEIQVLEAQAIKYLNITTSSISDLTGIESFTSLQYLNCNRNAFTTLNLSQNVALEWLRCQINDLPNLNISQNVALKYLDCSYNQLANLDVSQNLFLEELICGNNNQITNLDVSNNLLLQYLDCNSNQLSNLDISQNTELWFLNCYNNQLSEIDVSQLNYLNEFYCDVNLISKLDISNSQYLISLSCSYNQLEELYIKNNNLIWDWFLTNNGDGLDFSNNPNLNYICSDEEDLVMVQQKIVDYGYTNCHVNTYCSFTPNGTFYEINGTSKFDSDNNGCDVGDINYTNLMLGITDGVNTGSIIANQIGNYYIPVEAGNYTITPNLENPVYFNISPASFVVDFPTDASPFTQDFCVTANGVHSDVEVILIPTIPARPGFDANYKVIYKNKGNQVENGSISLAFDDTVLDYLSSNPVYDSSATNTFTWNYNNLQPFETREIEITFNVNSPTETPAVNIGDQINFLAEITPFDNDEAQYNNIFALKQIVVGSYDPNDKTCLEGEYVSSSVVGKYVHYVIRFENTGTYPAENIVVKDMIDTSKFDVSTLVPLHGSDEFYTRIKDNKVEFIFENINLDFNDATNDGYVAFKIKTLPTLNIGDTFSNDANIYFDYNFPITTNTFTTTIDNVLNNQDFAFENEFVLYPNPTKDILNISTKNQSDIQSVEIYNIIGQVVLAIPNSTQTINVSNLEAGTYFVKVNTEKGSSTTKFVKE